MSEVDWGRRRWRVGVVIMVLGVGWVAGVRSDGAAQDRDPVPAEVGEDATSSTVATDSQPAPAEAPPVEPACRLAPPNPVLIGASTACARCETGQAVLELTFDRVVDTETVARSVTLDPPVTLVSNSGTCARRVLLGGPLANATAYTATLDNGMVLTFSTRGGQPRLRMPSPMAVLGADDALPIQLQDLPSARLRVVPIRANEIATVAEMAGRQRAGVDGLEALPRAIRQRAQEREIRASDADEEGVQHVDVFALARTRGPVLAYLDAPGMNGYASIVQRARHAVVMKVGGERGLVWAVDTRNGRPAAHAVVTIYEGATVRQRGRTDANGLYLLPGENALRRAARPARARRDEDEWDDTYESLPTLRAVVEAGGEVAYASEGFDRGIEPWEFGVAYGSTREREALRGMVTAERGIYRPNETVHLLGILREPQPDGGLRAPGGRVHVAVRDPDGHEVLERDVRLSAYGTFRDALALPANARLGRYWVQVTRGSGAVSHSFEVGEYRADTFEVTLPPAGSVEPDAGGLRLPLEARYFYGSPVRGGNVSWRMSWRPRTIAPDAAPGFTFAQRHQDGYLMYGTSGELTLDDEGRAELDVSLVPFGADWSSYQAVDVVVEANVTDPAGDTITATTVHHVSPEETLFGLKTDRWVTDTGRGWDLSLIALGAATQEVVSGQRAQVQLVHRAWRAYSERGAGGTRYGGDYEEVVVAEREVVSGARAERVHFDLPEGGQYIARVMNARNEALAEVRVYAYGGAGGGVPVLNHPRIELVTDRPSYEPGQRAQVFAQVPWARSLALVTLEREGVLETRVQRLDGVSTPITLDIEEAHAPNVFVSVAALPIGGTDVASGVPLRMGTRELEVSPAARRLSVEVTPASETVEPGDATSVDVSVRDASGRPVRAEVTVWAADEGVLRLTGYQTPDPFAPAYARRAHRVRSFASVARYTLPDPYTWIDGGGDGDAGGASALRSRFLSTAFFSRAVVTDARGRARVRFEVPDNLTRWRVMAAVADRGERFGRGESAMTARKPLSAMPTLPRFLTRGDLVDAGLVVHNNTGRAGTARVSFEVDGPAHLTGPATREIPLAIGAQVPVRFPMVADATGTVEVRARVRMGRDDDGFALSLPVHPPTSLTHRRVATGVGASEYDEWFQVPGAVEPSETKLTVTVSTSVYASMERGVDALFRYPNGCVEQTTSGLIPMVLLEDMLRDVDPARFGSAAHHARMDQAITHVLRHQNGDGGFGLWPTSSSEGFLTAYALFGLLTARDHGYEVPPPRIREAVAYLTAHATEGDDMHGQFSNAETAPFAAYVLAYAQQDDAGLADRLSAHQETHSRFALGLLANALGRREDARAGSLLDGIDEHPERREARLLQERAGERDFMHFGRDLRATSSAVSAYVAAGERDRASALVAGILDDRGEDGSWGTTYNNMWALYALTAFAESEPRAEAARTIEVRIDEERHTLTLEPGARSARITLSGAALTAGYHRLRVSAPGRGGFRYDATLEMVPTPESARAQSQGLSITREIVDAASGEPVTHPVVGQLLRVRLSVRATGHVEQVAVTDRLPAGLEPVDTALATRAGSFGDGESGWSWRELHDERVTFFADYFPYGTQDAEYLARATRSGEFVHPPARAEAMYDPAVYGVTDLGRMLVRRATP